VCWWSSMCGLWIDAKPADSTLEAAMARLIHRYRLPPVRFHPVIEGWEVDFRVVVSPVILECDGWVFHGLDRTTFERDRIRDAELTAAGWIIVRLTYRSIPSTPGRTAGRIQNAVARWSAFPAPDAALTTRSFRRDSRLSCITTHVT